MEIPDFDYQILQLTDAFYESYPNPPYREILQKRQRAYNCLLFETRDYFICIPYRSEIAHPFACRFTMSGRAKTHRSGLDYTKIVIAMDLEHLGTQAAVIDQDEFRETMIRLEKIKTEAFMFVEDYKAHLLGERLLHPSEFRRRYAFSTLPYFHRELGIDYAD